MSGAQGAQGGAQAKARGKSPIALIIVVAVLLVGLIVTAMTCSAVMNVVDEYSGSGQGSSAITHEGPKPPISESEAAKSDDTWTVLFYLCGSNLETEGGLATYNLQEIANSDLGDKVTFVVEAGGCLQWQNRQFSSWNLNRAVFKGGNFQVVEQPPAASMAKSETLSDFVTWDKLKLAQMVSLISFYLDNDEKVKSIKLRQRADALRNAAVYYMTFAADNPSAQAIAKKYLAEVLEKFPSRAKEIEEILPELKMGADGEL